MKTKMFILTILLSSFQLKALVHHAEPHEAALISSAMIPLSIPVISSTAVDTALAAKLEVLREEATLHFANAEIIEASDAMKKFLQEMRKNEILKNLSDLEILEILYDEL